MSPTQIFLIYVLSITAVITVSFVILWIYRMKKRAEMGRATDMILYEIEQPQEETKDPGESFKEIISVMEQFYVGMSAIHEMGLKFWLAGPAYFALELALPSVGEETTFFAAVPRKYARLFEKQIQSIFPHARLTIKDDDYNIFNSEGVSSAAVIKLAENKALPIRTYSKLDADPLEVIANSFSKLKTEGDGAALQIILSPDDGSFIKSLKKASKRFKESGVLKLSSSKGFGGTIVDVINDLIFGNKKSKEEERGPVQFDENVYKLIEEKSASMIFKTNIRLVVSAKTDEEAESILKELESSFAQFTESHGNALKISLQKGKALEKTLYQFVMRSFDERSAIYLNVEELTSIYHFPIGFVSAPKLKYLKAKDAPPPAKLPQTGILLGNSFYRGEETPIRMTRDDRRRHLYVIGQTGTGKSVLMKNMIRQDIEAGEGVCFIDPHGDAIEEILGWIPKERVDDVILFDPGDVEHPMGLNMLEYDQSHPEQKTFIINELLEIFNKLFNMSAVGGPMFEQYFRNSAMLVMDDPSSGNTILEIVRVLSDKSFRDYKLSRSHNPVIKSFWRDIAEKAGGEGALQNMVPYITSKTDTFLANEIMRPIIAQEHSSFNFRKVMDEGKILLINLSKGKLGDLNAHLLGLIVVGKLSMAAMSRIDIIEEDKRRDFYLYIDEFQNVTTKSIATILSEARKYRLCLTMAHQFIGQLDEEIKNAVFGNVGSIVSFRIGVDDAEFMEKQFEPVFGVHDLINIENYNAYVKLLLSGQTERPFNIKTIMPPESNSTIAEAIKELSSAKYGRPRAEVEAEIAKKYNL